MDPHKGDRAIVEIERAVRELGLSGAKFHPGVQAFYPNDPRFAPLFQKISELGIPALFHTGTNGLGAGMPGGGGIKLDHTRPIYLDSLAADFPNLTIIGAHPSWPWEQEMIAILQHKPNVYNDLSGWSPKYIPPALLKEAAGRLNASSSSARTIPSSRQIAGSRTLRRWRAGATRRARTCSGATASNCSPARRSRR